MPVTKLKIASWNINSVRARARIVERFLDEEAPDILCLQETKAQDMVFPADLFATARLRPSRAQRPEDAPRRRHPVAPAAAGQRAATTGRTMARRATSAPGSTAGSGWRMSMSRPAATSPTATLNPKFGQKLDFIERMTRWSEKLAEPTLIVGDFNVAPLECDVWSHKALLDVVSHTPIEVETLGRLRQAHDWVDLGRKFIPAPERNFTWWSYRSQDWTANDRGRRLDHMWASPEPRAAGDGPPGARAVPRLGAAVGPCAADRRARRVSEPSPIERAIAALRAGRPVPVGGTDHPVGRDGDPGDARPARSDGTRADADQRRSGRWRWAWATSARRRCDERPVEVSHCDWLDRRGGARAGRSRPGFRPRTRSAR